MLHLQLSVGTDQASNSPDAYVSNIVLTEHNVFTYSDFLIQI